MNIIIIEDSSKAGFGGGQRITIDIINILNEHNHIYVFDTVTSSFFSDKLKNINLVPNKLKFNKTNSNFKLVTSFLILLNLIYTFCNVLILKKFINKYNLNNNSIVYATSKNGLILAYFLNLFFDVKFIYHAHLIENFFVKILISFLTKNAFKVICVSEIVAEQFNFNNIIVVENSIDVIQESIKTIKNKQELVVASISTLNHVKGIDDFISSYQYIENKKVKYHIYGDGPLKNKFLKLCNKDIIYKNHALNVRNILLSKIDILVVSTIIPESFCMVILEAFSCGVPVVSTNIGMQKEHIVKSNAGELVSIKSPKEIANKIDQILSSYAVYSLLSKNGLAYSKNFDKSSFSKKINDIFNTSII